jgi:hypothetical protein
MNLQESDLYDLFKVSKTFQVGEILSVASYFIDLLKETSVASIRSLFLLKAKKDKIAYSEFFESTESTSSLPHIKDLTFSQNKAQMLGKWIQFCPGDIEVNDQQVAAIRSIGNQFIEISNRILEVALDDFSRIIISCSSLHKLNRFPIFCNEMNILVNGKKPNYFEDLNSPEETSHGQGDPPMSILMKCEVESRQKVNEYVKHTIDFAVPKGMTKDDVDNFYSQLFHIIVCSSVETFRNEMDVFKTTAKFSKDWFKETKEFSEIRVTLENRLNSLHRQLKILQQCNNAKSNDELQEKLQTANRNIEDIVVDQSEWLRLWKTKQEEILQQQCIHVNINHEQLKSTNNNIEAVEQMASLIIKADENSV